MILVIFCNSNNINRRSLKRSTITIHIILKVFRQILSYLYDEPIHTNLNMGHGVKYQLISCL